jgi:hypothetical protein
MKKKRPSPSHLPSLGLLRLPGPFPSILLLPLSLVLRRATCTREGEKHRNEACRRSRSRGSDGVRRELGRLPGTLHRALPHRPRRCIHSRSLALVASLHRRLLSWLFLCVRCGCALKISRFRAVSRGLWSLPEPGFTCFSDAVCDEVPALRRQACAQGHR